MKKGVIIFIILFISIFHIVSAEQYCPEDGGACYDVTPLKDVPIVSAEQYCPEDGGDCYDVTPLKDIPSDGGGGSKSSASSGGGNAIKVTVSEKVPGAGCVKKGNQYECTIQPGFKTIENMIGQIIKWFTAIAALAGVLFIVINGILLSMDGGEKENIKKRIVQTLMGLILLLLTSLILSIIAPWVYG